ncbi:MAG TPA: hypothetical protein VKA08_02485 [Balneolales bacterium]|nr:hypothetical protein [Balneolales bacterium]
MNSIINKPKAVLNWSGGKDCSFTLYKVLQSNEFEVSTLLTTVSGKYHRISMHGVREELLNRQAMSLEISLHKVIMPEEPSMEEYNNLMQETMTELAEQDISTSIFGDIFLEDLRQYREEQLKKVGFNAIFPIWKIPTTELAETFIDSGFKAVIVCVDERYLDKTFAGREFNRALLQDLPPNVDPCGENGEFHTFVYDGPIFRQPVKHKKGEVVYRTYRSPGEPDDSIGFWYCDLVEG